VSSSVNIALRGQELQRLIANLKLNLSGFGLDDENNQILEAINSSYQELATIPTQLEAALAREEAQKLAQQEAIANAMNFLDGFTNAIQPIIQSYIEKSSEKFNSILEKNKDDLKFTDEELRLAANDRNIATVIVGQKFNKNIKKEYNDITTSIASAINDSKNSLSENKTLETLFSDKNTYGKLTKEEISLWNNLDPIEKELLIRHALARADHCVKEDMEAFEKNISKIDIPTSKLAEGIHNSMKVNAFGDLKAYLKNATELEAPEKEKLAELLKKAGVTNAADISSYKLDGELTTNLADILNILRSTGDATSQDNVLNKSLNEKLKDFERLAAKKQAAETQTNEIVKR